MNYTEEDLKHAFTEGFFTRQDNSLVDLVEALNEYLESLKPKPKEKTIPITYGLIKATCGWSRWCDVTDGNHYAIKEWGEFEPGETFYITESQAKQLNFI